MTCPFLHTHSTLLQHNSIVLFCHVLHCAVCVCVLGGLLVQTEVFRPGCQLGLSREEELQENPHNEPAQHRGKPPSALQATHPTVMPLDLHDLHGTYTAQHLPRSTGTAPYEDRGPLRFLPIFITAPVTSNRLSNLLAQKRKNRMINICNGIRDPGSK